MAHLTETQKKKRNAFVALLVGILAVLAAITFVVYSGVMSKSAFLENDDLATGFAQIFDKAEREVTKEDLASVKSVSIIYDKQTDVSAISIGLEDWATEVDNYNAQLEAQTEAQTAYDEAAEIWEGEEVPEDAVDPATIVIPEVTADPQKLLKSTKEDFKLKDINVNDLKYFTGVKSVYLEGVEFETEVVKNLTSLETGSFINCGIKDVSGFAALDFTNIESLDLSNNEISDWTPLESVADKVIVQSFYIEGYGYYPMMTLADMLAQETEGTEETEEHIHVEGDDHTHEEADVVDTENVDAENVDTDTADEVNEEANEEVNEEANEEVNENAADENTDDTAENTAAVTEE